MQPQPLIAARDVPASSRCHRGDEYQQLVDGAGTLILQLHAWDTHEHPHLGNPATRPYGNGVLLWFRIDDFDAAVARAGALGAPILEGPKVNPAARHREICLRDPEGYVVVLAGAPGDL